MSEQAGQMTQTDITAIERACERLIKRFVWLNDSDDNDGLATLFTTDGSYARPMDPTRPIRGREAILGVLKGRPPRRSRHLMSNILVDVLSPTEARGCSYFSFLSSTELGGTPPLAAEPKLFVGEYRDEFVRIDGEWKIRSRTGSMSLLLNAAK